MNPQHFDDQTLMAYADGALDDQARGAVEQAMLADASIAARVAALRRGAELAKEAFDSELHTPIPAALLESVRAAIAQAGSGGEGQETGKSKRSSPARSTGFVGRGSLSDFFASVLRPSFAFSAMVLVTVGYLIGTLYRADEGSEMLAMSGFQIVADTEQQARFVEALNELGSGEQRRLLDDDAHGIVEIIASFRDQSGTFCREFKLGRDATHAVVGVACNTARTWNVTFAAASPSQDGLYTPASSLSVLDAYLTSINAGSALAREEEKAALNALNL
ncbi:MAG: anti-sigma factor family protein [Burkholderiales bacterium]